MRSLLANALAGLALFIVASCSQDSPIPTDPVGQPGLMANALAPVFFQQISDGFNPTCAVTTDSRAYCWTNGIDAPAVAVPGNKFFRIVSVGWSFTCGIATPGDGLYCWGSNYMGQLGDGTTTDRAQPTRVASNLRFRQVSAGDHHACAVTVGDIVYCWGWNGFGQLGDGTHTQRLVPTKVAGYGHYNKVSAGRYHSCAVTLAGKGFCWGSNSYWQVGNNAPTQRDQLKPAAIVGGLTFADVQAGYNHTCGVTTGRQAYCWGHNGPELGSPSSSADDYQKTPRLVAGGLAFRAVDGGYYYTCGVTTDNVAYCWGSGPLGAETITENWTPVRIRGARFSQVTVGHSSCGVTLDNRAFCWSETLKQLAGPE